MSTLWDRAASMASSAWPSILCSRCQKIRLVKMRHPGDPPPPLWDVEESYVSPGRLRIEHHMLEDLKSSANYKNCPCCKLFLAEGELNFARGISEKRNAVIIDLTTGKLIYEVTTLKANFQVEFEFYADSEISKRALELATGNFLSGRTVAENVNTPEGHQIILSWIKTCEQRHPRCSQTLGKLPSRVLDVSTKTPRLIDAKDIQARYIALSHCWGLEPLLTTTAETLVDRREGIPMSTLPPTFADAVSMTRSLNINYLWVDSLCIIQNSVEDWLSESANMRRYYQDAFLVISALEGPSSHSKLFQPRENLKSVELSQPHLLLRPLVEPEHTIFSNSILNSRAWALQERLLATRIIHFSKHEMLWECSTNSERESSLIVRENTTNRDHIILSEDGNFKRIISILKAQPGLDTKVAMNTWYRLVAQYTRRKLTRSSDKLAAVSAIASNFHSITGFTYIAGIWKEDLQSLLWFSSFPDAKPETYQAPTWSWAATKGQVNLRFDSECAIESEHDARILEIEATISGPDQFGPVSGGKLKLRASTIEVQYTPSWSGNRARVAGRSTQSTDVTAGYLHSQFSSLGIRDNTYLGEAVLDYDEPQRRTVFNVGEMSEISCKAIFIQDRLPTQVAKSTKMCEEDKLRNVINWFMLVVRNEGEEETYRRIGVLYTFQQLLSLFIRDGGEWFEREMTIV